MAATMVEKYQSLQDRARTLANQQQFWLGKKEQHEAARAGIIARLSSFGLGALPLHEAAEQLKAMLEQQLSSTEQSIASAEAEFNSLKGTQ